MKQYTDITVLLDRSGSMASIKEAMQTAFNTFISEHKAVPSTRLTLVQFDDMDPYNVVYQNVPITAAEPLKLRPRGNTPLLDAFCKTIDETGRRLAAMPEYERPDQVLMVVITDGQENASRKHSRNDVFARVTNQRDNYKWQFLYLGANQDVFAEAASFGIPQNWSMVYNATPRGVTSSAGAMSVNTVAYASNTGGMRGTAMKSFTAEQRADATEQNIDPNAGNSNVNTSNQTWPTTPTK